MTIRAIVAMSSNKGIGLDNKLPWHFKHDMLRFKKLTIGQGNNAIVMGKNTWNSIGILPYRHNFILTTSTQFSYVKNNYLIRTFHNISELLAFIQHKYDDIWVIGGSKIYKSFLDHHIIDDFYITLINKNIHCDTFMHPLPHYYLKKQVITHDKLFEGKYKVLYIHYTKIKKEMRLMYKDSHPCVVKDIHFDDFPHIYFSIEYNGKECQTNISNLQLYDI